LYFVRPSLFNRSYRDKKVVGVFVRFRAASAEEEDSRDDWSWWKQTCE
jgi:hypothetical protein